MRAVLTLQERYLEPEHPAVRTYRLLAVFAVVGHLYFVLFAFLFYFFVLVHGLKQVFDVADEPLALCKIAERGSFTAMRAFRPFFLNPSS